MFSVLALVLCAGPVHVAAVAWKSSGVEPAVADAALGRFLGPMRERGISVTDRIDVPDPQRSCAAPACLMEIASPVNATAVMTGAVAKTDTGFTASFRVFEPTSGKVLISDAVQEDTEEELLEWAQSVGRRTALDLYEAFGLQPKLRVPPFLFFAGGVALAVIGTVLYGVAQTDASRLEGDVSNLSLDDIHSVANQGRALQTATPVFLGLGGALLLVAAIWLVASPYDFSQQVTR